MINGRCLLGDHAVTVASMTGLTLDTTRDKERNIVRFLDTEKLKPWDRFRVVVALVGAYALYEQIHGAHPDRVRCQPVRSPADRVVAHASKRRGLGQRSGAA